MGDDDLKSLIQRSGSTDKIYLLKAKERAKRKMDENPTSANVAAFERAKKALAACVVGESAPTARDRSDILENAHQVLLYLREQGWKAGKHTVYKAVEEGRLKARRDGGWAKRTADAWARAHLVRKVNPAPAGDAPVGAFGPGGEEPGAVEGKAKAQASLFEVQAERNRLKLEQERGAVVAKADVERELAARAQAFRYGLENFPNEIAPAVAALFGADERAAMEILALVGGDPDKKAELQAWMQRQEAAFVEMVQGKVEGFLEPYSRGTWWTEDMARAMGMGMQPEIEDGGTGAGD